jgi:hypothetical protein
MSFCRLAWRHLDGNQTDVWRHTSVCVTSRKKKSTWLISRKKIFFHIIQQTSGTRARTFGTVQYLPNAHWPMNWTCLGVHWTEHALESWVLLIQILSQPYLLKLFFHLSIPLRSLINGLNHFCIWLWIRWEIRKYKRLHAMHQDFFSKLRAVMHTAESRGVFWHKEESKHQWFCFCDSR